ncbi:MAG: hypothetical protein AB1449_06020 [Chloroflexota bacterium]
MELLPFQNRIAIAVQFEEPGGQVVAQVPQDDVFEAYGVENCRYPRKQISFQALETGTFTLHVTLYSPGIRRVDLSLRERR